jgi:hypothetical protein
MPLNKTPERGEYGERTELGTPSPTVLTLKERYDCRRKLVEEPALCDLPAIVGSASGVRPGLAYCDHV